ncbi:MAG: hypothetical protein IPL32_13775 [Chloracidobacterium sp.]|nr:hypothetical protein [Chloracidobacterium sp.]
MLNMQHHGLTEVKMMAVGVARRATSAFRIAPRATANASYSSIYAD